MVTIPPIPEAFEVDQAFKEVAFKIAGSRALDAKLSQEVRDLKLRGFGEIEAWWRAGIEMGLLQEDGSFNPDWTARRDKASQIAGREKQRREVVLRETLDETLARLPAVGSARDTVDWVAANLFALAPDYSTCPCRAAASLLLDVKEDNQLRRSFWTSMWAVTHLKKSSAGAAAAEEDDGDDENNVFTRGAAATDVLTKMIGHAAT